MMVNMDIYPDLSNEEFEKRVVDKTLNIPDELTWRSILWDSKQNTQKFMILLKHGLDANKLHYNLGYSLLTACILAKNSKCTRALLQYGANIDLESSSPPEIVPKKIVNAETFCNEILSYYQTRRRCLNYAFLGCDCIFVNEAVFCDRCVDFKKQKKVLDIIILHKKKSITFFRLMLDHLNGVLSVNFDKKNKKL